ncbi:MAG TPA: Fe2+-dependent dioxygenase [Gammaproteobacteria bacterium]|nr:Fe2+-dependent dioxygenase [Gammaproteobacteria bacterium]MEC8012177.1 Fe2+-dependent dioxygenase [Pseudomonadota bacterium]HBF07552.1 Fe2+-dependent dioxygenase [Gammaproteobacteria bacterium]HCK92635.1 Fe2+-dependent dioxygenase [Gammaproteobacteria bacterium]|tara:strand:+ start:4575 stop:5267 length:693 start_codon:yes stop_codon:yes gene_type:complete
MLLVIENVLSPELLEEINRCAMDGQWIDGALTAGSLAQKVKSNLQLDDNTELAQQLQDIVLEAVATNSLFCSAALPQMIYPPKFNLYKNGGAYGTHVDNAVLSVPGTGQPMRSDLSATVFLTDPTSYAGGELVIETEYGAQEIKLEAGDMVLYPSSSLHQVKPVTEGERLASFFWIQSLVRDTQERSMLFDLDQSIQSLTGAADQSETVTEEVSRLTGLYHNLVRRWSEF